VCFFSIQLVFFVFFFGLFSFFFFVLNFSPFFFFLFFFWVFCFFLYFVLPNFGEVVKDITFAFLPSFLSRLAQATCQDRAFANLPPSQPSPSSFLIACEHYFWFPRSLGLKLSVWSENLRQSANRSPSLVFGNPRPPLFYLRRVPPVNSFFP